MDSENIFVRALGPDDGPFDIVEELSQLEKQKYVLTDCRLKFSEPEKLTYLENRIHFFAFDTDETQKKINRLQLFIEDHEKLLKDIETRFGPPEFKLNLSGEGRTLADETQQLKYNSLSWFIKPYALTYSLFPVQNSGAESLITARLKILNS